jgi:hypothetical protein
VDEDEYMGEDGEHTHSAGVSRSGGRRWSPSHWVVSTPVAEGLDRLASSRPTDVVDRTLEYRVVWDESRNMWRVDTRRFVPGG